MTIIRKVLVAIADFEVGNILLTKLLEFLEDCVTEVHLLNVIDKENLEHLATFRNMETEEVLSQIKKENSNMLDKLHLEFQDTHFYITSQITEGLVAETILKSSNEEGVDFIVMGSRREKLAKRLMKNHVRYVVELANIPVLLFPI